MKNYREGMLKILLEVLVMRRPVHITNIVECKETVQYGKNEYFVPIKDIKVPLFFKQERRGFMQ